MAVPETLREARVDAGYTQAEMAEKLGISRPTYAGIEENPDRATVLQARRICQILSRSYEHIFFARNDRLTSIEGGSKS